MDNIFNALAEKEWECHEKGLKKTLIDFNFTSMTKASEISKCLVEIYNIRNVNERETMYLKEETKNKEFWIELSTALTPIDRYTEIFLEHMFEGEISRCEIKTSSDKLPIEFIIKLNKIDFVNDLYRLSVTEMYNLAFMFKENGVKMFKKYPKFAQEYFCRAAKCLISFKPFNGLTKQADGINAEQMEKLLQTVQSNIAACLIRNKERYEDVIYLTEFIEKNNLNDNEKVIYRRAMAFCNLKNYEKAIETLEIVHNYKKNKEFLNLHNKIMNDWKLDTNKYNNVIKKMFG